MWIENDVCVYSMKKQGVMEHTCMHIQSGLHIKRNYMYLIYLQLDVCIHVYAVVKGLMSLTRAVIYFSIHVICTF